MRISLPSKPKEDEVGVAKPNPMNPTQPNPTQLNFDGLSEFLWVLFNPINNWVGLIMINLSHPTPSM